MGNTNILVSIIVPCYNQAQYLSDALKSVLDQTYFNWECIIVNDGSPDETELIARAWLVKDSRFKYVFKENGGLSSARNKGIDIATGEWVQFLDADDYLHKDKLKISIDNIRENPTLELVVTNYKMFSTSIKKLFTTSNFYNQENLTYEQILFEWGESFVIPIHCGFFKTNIIRLNQFDESFKAVEDWFMWLNYLKIVKHSIYLNLPLAYYRENPKSMTKDYELMQNSLVKAYKQIYKSIPNEISDKFILKIIDRLNNKILNQKARITSLEYKNEHYIRIFFSKMKRKLLK